MKFHYSSFKTRSVGECHGDHLVRSECRTAESISAPCLYMIPSKLRAKSPLPLLSWLGTLGVHVMDMIRFPPVFTLQDVTALGGASLFLIVSLIIEFLLPTIQYVALKTKINNPLLLQLSILNITMCNNTPIVCFSVGLGGCICLFCAFLSPDSGRTEVMI